MLATVSTQPVVDFIKELFLHQQKKSAMIAISGGIDSAVALTLLTQALGPDSIHTFLLPYGDQDLADGLAICEYNQIPAAQRHVVEIKPLVTAATQLGLAEADPVRLGNLMARSRMLVIFDWAKKLDALVCGTENKSEHYLGYFTRFGDAASDLEPLSQWYKTQVRQVAGDLKLPTSIQTKAPSAGLWANQTDETELGFSYEQADQVLSALIDQGGWDGLAPAPTQLTVDQVPPEVVEKVVHQVLNQAFKRQVPYQLPSPHHV